MDRIEPVGGPGDRSGDQPSRPPSAAAADAQTPSAQTPSVAQTPSDTSNYLSPSTPQVQQRAQQRPQRPGTRARRPSVRIQRLPSAASLTNATNDQPGSPLPQPQPQPQPQQQQRQSQTTLDDSVARSSTRSPNFQDNFATVDEDEAWQGRRRSSSEPRPGRWSSPSPIALTRISTPMVPLTEEASNNSRRGAHRSNSNIISNDANDNNNNNNNNNNTDTGNDTDSTPFPDFQNNEKLSVNPPATPERPKTGRLRRTSQAAISRLSRNRASTVAGPVPRVTDGDNHHKRANEDDNRVDEYGDDFVNVLDVIDPEVSALSTLTNVQNSLFVPDLFGFVNREPTYTLSPPRADPASEEEGTTTDASEQLHDPTKVKEGRPSIARARDTSISAVLDEGNTRFAVLPEQSNLEGWTKEDIEELNDHVRHMLHSRRSKFKRGMKGFGKYVSKPLGFFITLYATLITLFGLAWVLFLIGWVNVGGKQLYVINVIDNVLVALFAVMGDGLAPFRAVDTYHMTFIARYTFLTWKIREKRDLPELKNKNDLPTRREMDVDVEWGETPKDEQYEFSVLNRVQQLRLIHHQNKFAKSHTFYKPHETITHHAFPTRLLVAIVVVLDCHSLLQIALGSCTWSIDYHVRPFALTTVILCCSICCNITGGVLITIGDRRTRKKDVVERMFRQQLTSEAMKIMQKRRRREEKRNTSLSQIQSRQSRPSTTLSPQATPYDGT